MSQPTLNTTKKLFALCGNRCAFPDCTSPIVEVSGTVSGEMCHIKAASQDGPRYDPQQTGSERHGAANLVLMCGRHHKIIDSEPTTYTVPVLLAMKLQHEQVGLVEISPAVAKAAQALLDSYARTVIHSNDGQIAINSPGVVQAKTINLWTTKSKLVVAPPSGSIAEDRRMLSYCKYLIDRYQTFQKADTGKVDAFKYMAIHQALKREFKVDWKLLDSADFPAVIRFLQRRIDNTRQGRINGARQSASYHSFDDHP